MTPMTSMTQRLTPRVHCRMVVRPLPSRATHPYSCATVFVRHPSRGRHASQCPEPLLPSAHGWGPDAGLLMLLAWRMRRADAWPAWWAAPMGFANDLVTAQPIGLSTSYWALCMLVMEAIDRRSMFRDYLIEWVLAAILLAMGTTVAWKVAGWQGAAVPFDRVAPNILLAVLFFPLAAALVAALDRWRLGR